MKFLAALFFVLVAPAAALAQDADLKTKFAALGALDFIFIGIAIYALVRLAGRFFGPKGDRNADNDGPPTYDIDPDQRNAPPDDAQDPTARRRANAQAAWGYLSGDKSGAPRRQPDTPPADSGRQAGQGPAPGGNGQPGQGFDEADFLRGAKMMYSRVRQSWAKRDLQDLAQFTTAEMQARFTAWAAGSPATEVMDVLLVNAQVLDVKTENGVTTVEVSYEATVSDNPAARDTRIAREAWRFTKNDADPKASWKLDDMQTVQ